MVIPKIFHHGIFDLIWLFIVGLFLHTRAKHRRQGMSLHHLPGNFATPCIFISCSVGSFTCKSAMGILHGTSVFTLIRKSDYSDNFPHPENCHHRGSNAGPSASEASNLTIRLPRLTFRATEQIIDNSSKLELYSKREYNMTWLLLSI